MVGHLTFSVLALFHLCPQVSSKLLKTKGLYILDSVFLSFSSSSKLSPSFPRSPGKLPRLRAGSRSPLRRHHRLLARHHHMTPMPDATLPFPRSYLGLVSRKTRWDRICRAETDVPCYMYAAVTSGFQATPATHTLLHHQRISFIVAESNASTHIQQW